MQIFAVLPPTTIECSHPHVGHALQYRHRYLLNAVGLGFPIFHGTGMMVSSVGMLPYQGPIHVVIGAPVPVPKLEGDINSDEGRKCVICLAACSMLLFKSCELSVTPYLIRGVACSKGLLLRTQGGVRSA